VITTHDLPFARAVADTVAVLADGMIVERGPIAEVLDHPSHEATRRLMALD
jgi:ABC-type microcin C transport system duplicated ATPase subunit YejF